MTDAIGFDPHEDSRGGWDVKIDGPERQRLEAQLTKMDEGERVRMFNAAARILGHCPSPTAESGDTKGLALGKVQSGKTSAFIGLTALAFDNGYRVVVVLAGTKMNLVGQNYKRIIKSLGLDSRNDRKIGAYSTVPKPDKGVRYQDLVGLLRIGRNVLITVFKHPKHIAHVTKLLSSSELNRYPTLIIDDEGDQASLNTKGRKRGQSGTYKGILALRGALNVRAYVSFTATPQAPLLASTISGLSPEFCVRIEPGRDYTGGSTFHGPDRELYIREIPDSEVGFEEQGGIPDSLLVAFATFFVGAAIRTLRRDPENHSMLVHTSQKQYIHELASHRIEALIENWQQKIQLSPRDPSRGELVKLLKRGYDDLCEHAPDRYPTWAEILTALPEALKDHRRYVVNSSEIGDLPDLENLPMKNNIFIGGNMLDRGVTLPGLAVTYITRWAKVMNQADTVEQRARWFGYKKEYLDLCTVYAPRNVLKGYEELLGHEDDLWDSLKRWEDAGHPVMTWPRLFKLDPAFRLTRPSVARTKNVKLSGWVIQKRPEMDHSIGLANCKLIERFFGTQPAQLESFGAVHHLVVRGCKPSVVAEELLTELRNGHAHWEAGYLSELFARFSAVTGSDGVDVLWMSADTRTRTLGNRGDIKNLMQGRNGPPNVYAGDRNIHGNRLQVQVHQLRLLNESGDQIVPKTIALALYIPDAIADAVQRLVTTNEA